MKCGCGKEARYVIRNFETGDEIYSCNKYKRCLTLEEQTKLDEQKKILDTWGMRNI